MTQQQSVKADPPAGWDLWTEDLMDGDKWQGPVPSPYCPHETLAGNPSGYT
jgi:hypothetical protein